MAKAAHRLSQFDASAGLGNTLCQSGVEAQNQSVALIIENNIDQVGRCLKLVMEV
jgi:hypothetical protein